MEPSNDVENSKKGQFDTILKIMIGKVSFERWLSLLTRIFLRFVSYLFDSNVFFCYFISFSGVFWLNDGIITSKSCIAAKTLNYMKYKVTKLNLDQDLWEGWKKAR